MSPEDIVKCEERYSKGKKVHQTVRHVALKHGLRVDELNAKVIWPLYKKYGHALDALKVSRSRHLVLHLYVYIFTDFCGPLWARGHVYGISLLSMEPPSY